MGSLTSFTTRSESTSVTQEFYGDCSIAYSPYVLEKAKCESGPKSRSDLSIQKEIVESFATHSIISESGINVMVQEGNVILVGEVPLREMIEQCEQVAEKCFGIRDIFNHLIASQDMQLKNLQTH